MRVLGEDSSEDRWLDNARESDDDCKQRAETAKKSLPEWSRMNPDDAPPCKNAAGSSRDRKPMKLYEQSFRVVAGWNYAEATRRGCKDVRDEGSTQNDAEGRSAKEP